MSGALGIAPRFVPARIDRKPDPAHTREAVRARSLARRSGPVWNAYAHCDRAPFGWELS